MRATSPRLSSDPVLARAQRGDRGAIGTILEQNRERCTNFIFGILQDRELAQDTYQNACVKVIEHIQTFDARYQFSTWLYTIARNEAINRRRSSKRVEFVDIEVMANELPHPDGRPDAHLRNAALLEAISHAVRALPEKMRAAFSLVLLEGHAYDEASQRSGVPMGTLKSRVNRAKSLVRTFLQENYPELLKWQCTK